MERRPERLRPRRPRQAARRRRRSASGSRRSWPRRRPATPPSPSAAASCSPCAASRPSSSRSSSSCRRPDKPDEARVLLDPNELDKKGTTADRLVRPLARRQAGRRVALEGRQRVGRRSRLRRRDGQAGGRGRSRASTAARPAATWPGRPTARASTTPATRAASERPAGGPRLLPAGLLPRPRHARPRRTATRLGKDLPRIAEIKLEADRHRPACWRRVQNGDGGEFAHFVRSPDGKWKQFAASRTRSCRRRSGRRTTCSSSRARTPRAARCCGSSADDPDLAKAQVVIPEGKDTIVTDFYGMPSRQTVLPTATPALRHLPARRPDGAPLLRLSTASRSPAPKQPADLHRRRPGPPDRRRHPLLRTAPTSSRATYYLYRAKANETVKLPLTSPPPVESERRRGGPRVRHEQGRHEGAGQHPRSRRARSSTARTRAW